MNMAGMNPAMAGGPVGGAMMMMNNGSPATQSNPSGPTEQMKQLNGYIYEYFLKLGHFDIARALVREEKFEFRTKAPVKQSPGRRKDGEVNGVDADAMDVDIKDDIPDDLPRPGHESNSSGSGFLFEWFSIFHDLYSAHRNLGKAQQSGNMGAPAQYLMQTQNIQRMRENQQNPNLNRPGMMNPNQFNIRMRNGMVNGNMPRAEMAKTMTPQQLQQMQAKQAQILQQQQQQLQRDQAEGDMNGRPSPQAEGDNGGSPSKRPRLENQQFNNPMMANGRPVPGGVPQGMMIQNAFNPNMTPAQFQRNGGMPQKPMQPGMPNGMINMNNAGSPMMAGMNPAQFGGGDMAMEMYNSGRMGGQPGMQGAPGAQSGNHALQDYQMQLMLLEQQNKKRLMMARQEQDNAVNRDGAPMPVGMGGTGMSPSGSRSGTSPNPTDQMKRTPQLGGLPGSPAAGENMQGRSPAAMGFINGMPSGDFNPAMFMQDKGMAGPGGPNMRPPTSMDINMARQQGRMGGQFQGGQPMVQQPSQGQQQPMGTPGQRNEMPPPQAPATGAQRNQPSSPAQTGNAPPTPSQPNKANPKGKKATKEESNKKRPAKKNSTANAPTENEPPATPTPSTPITPQHPTTFNSSGGKGPNQGMANANQPQPVQAMAQTQPQIQQPDMQANAFPSFDGPDQNFNLDFSTLENTDVLENFDFDSFLNTTTDDAFAFDNGMVGGDFSLETGD